MSDAQNDPRFAHLSEAGQGELAVYLDWITASNLADTEYAFVTYVMGRAQMNNARHLFAIWMYGARSNYHAADLCQGWLQRLALLKKFQGKVYLASPETFVSSTAESARP